LVKTFLITAHVTKIPCGTIDHRCLSFTGNVQGPSQQVALVTGGARGIGKAAVELLARERAKVHACDLDIAEAYKAEGVVQHLLDVPSLES
jgi:NADPH:quinone reductase-like Zn-dependent oxidoreductase